MLDTYKPKHLPHLHQPNIHRIRHSKSFTHPILDIFESKSNSSNIDLQTYLNNTHYIPSQHVTPKLQHTLRLHPLKGQYQPKKTSLPMLIIAILCIIVLGLSIVVGLAYTLIGIG
ncbi:hypothetical protein [Acinetobacter rathckeae]|uniref:hypothetical protein n=1 Tax=Acinetobacter rathckeae TaxID=2605272 RepID=UPI001D18913E|nr:hypothetical protein [Acinetobacter rathckeae]